MRSRRSRLRDMARRLFNPTTPTSNDCSARYIGRAVMPGSPLRPIDGATVRLPVSNGPGYLGLHPDVKARNRSPHVQAPRLSTRSAVGL